MKRRRFLATSSTAATAALGFPAITSARSPNAKLNIAAIGVGGRGGHNLEQVAGSETVVALCDVNTQNLAAAAGRHPDAKTYAAFRELYADSNLDFDAVVVSTTEHTHAFATLPALQRKKHVYCEKPLTRDVYEARLITEAAAQAGVATQMGTQIHAGENYRRVVELVRAGAIGAVSDVHGWVGRAWGWKPPGVTGGDITDVTERPTEEHPVPEGLDWDLWIGPAPYRPFNNVSFPGPKWYRWWDFGNGTMSDLGSHWNDLPCWALDLDAPTTVEAGGPPPHPEIAPASMWARYSYPARGGRAPLALTWYQGNEKPEIWQQGKIPQWDSGCLFIGSEGMLLADYGKYVLLPEDKFANFERPAPSIPPSIGHHQEWLHACKTGEPTTCHFGYAGPLTEANHLGNVAYRAGSKLRWDAVGLATPGNDAAAQYLRRTYREGWVLA
ncbi:Gfo/Idh/MocA family oxidoreductase [soil metagenome]